MHLVPDGLREDAVWRSSFICETPSDHGQQARHIYTGKYAVGDARRSRLRPRVSRTGTVSETRDLFVTVSRVPGSSFFEDNVGADPEGRPRRPGEARVQLCEIIIVMRLRVIHRYPIRQNAPWKPGECLWLELGNARAELFDANART